MRRLGMIVATIVSMLLAAAFLAGCGSSDASDGGGSFQADSKSTCFTEMSPDQKAQLQKYAADHGNNLDQASNNADGTQDVCVIEKGSDGSYNQHYYKRDDHFGDYLLYSMLFGRSNALLAYGVFNGDLSPSDAFVLSMLTGVNSQGLMYHPYGYVNGQFMRSPQVINNVRVTNVYYGSSTRPTPYSSSMTPPSGYATKSIPDPSDKVANMSGGKVTSTSSGGLGAMKQAGTGSGSGSGSGVNTKVNPAPAPKPAAPPPPKAPAPAPRAGK